MLEGIEGLEFIDDEEQALAVLDFLERLEDEVTDSPEFKTLFGKTQMFYGDSGRSRGGHSYNIGLTAGSMSAKAFDRMHADKKGNNPKLFDINKRIKEKIGRILGFSHDLGHTPLGHDGESVLNKKLGKLTKDDAELRETVAKTRAEDFKGVKVKATSKDAENYPSIEPGVEYEYEEYQAKKRKEDEGIGFEHNEYSAQIYSRIFRKVLSDLERESATDTFASKEAARMLQGAKSISLTRGIQTILAHSRSRHPSIPKDFIAQVVRQADKVEYMNYDFEEYAEMGCFPIERTPENAEQNEQFMRIVEQRAADKHISVQEVLDYFNLSGEERRRILEDDMIEEAFVGINGKPPKGRIDDKMAAMEKAKICAEFKDDTLFYTAEDGKRGLITGNNVERQEVILDRLVQYYIEHPEQIPQSSVNISISKLNPNEVQVQDGETVTSYDPTNVQHENTYEYLKTFLSSITNDECERIYQQLVRERIEKGEGYGIVPVSKQDVDDRIARNLKKSSVKKEKTVNGKEVTESVIDHSKTTYGYLPQTIRDRIEANRARHAQEVEQDNELYLEMLGRDQERQSEVLVEHNENDSNNILQNVIDLSKLDVTSRDMKTVSKQMIERQNETNREMNAEKQQKVNDEDSGR